MILTNNPEIEEKNIIRVTGDQVEVLEKCRDMIHKGHRLITSPLAASGRMHYSPYRTIVISDDAGELDEKSVEYIESSLMKLKNALSLHEVDHRNSKDYGVIDKVLFENALKEIERFGIVI